MISEMKDEFSQIVSRDKSSLSAEMLRILYNDILGKNTAANDTLFAKLSQREKVLYSFIHKIDSDKEAIKQIIRDLDNEVSPLNSNLQTIIDGDKLPFISSEIPRYFQNKIQIKYGQKQLDSRRSINDFIAESINKFKIVKAFIQLMQYHQLCIYPDQYLSDKSETYLSVHRFGIDLFSQNVRIKEDFKLFFVSLFENILAPQAMVDVLVFFSQVED